MAVMDIIAWTTVSDYVAGTAIAIAAAMQAEAAEQFRKRAFGFACNFTARIATAEAVPVARGAIADSVARGAPVRSEQIAQTSAHIDTGRIASDFVTRIAKTGFIARIASNNRIARTAVAEMSTTNQFFETGEEVAVFYTSVACRTRIDTR